MIEFESFRICFSEGAQIDAVAEPHRAKMAIKPPKGEIAYLEMSGHDLLRLAEFLKLLAMGIVTRP